MEIISNFLSGVICHPKKCQGQIEAFSTFFLLLLFCTFSVDIDQLEHLYVVGKASGSVG